MDKLTINSEYLNNITPSNINFNDFNLSDLAIFISKHVCERKYTINTENDEIITILIKNRHLPHLLGFQHYAGTLPEKSATDQINSLLNGDSGWSIQELSKGDKGWLNENKLRIIGVMMLYNFYQNENIELYNPPTIRPISNHYERTNIQLITVLKDAKNTVISLELRFIDKGFPHYEPVSITTNKNSKSGRKINIKTFIVEDI